MAEFSIRLTVERLELEVKGTKEEIPHITLNAAQQLAGMFQPVIAIVEGEEDSTSNNSRPQEPPNETSPRKRSRRRPAQPQMPSGSSTIDDAIDWNHDPSKYGVPRQGWSASQKALWLLYGVSQEAGINESSGEQIAATFNRHFRHAGPILPRYVNRDLGRLRAGKKPPVSEDAKKTPSTWFLIEEGMARARALVVGMTPHTT
jgi:hypothetical protein